MKSLKKYLREEEGLVAIEYGVIAVGIALAIIVAVGLVGGQLNTMFQSVVGALGG